MELHEFQPGDRVRYCRSLGRLQSPCGTVIGWFDRHIFVEFDESFEFGHDGFGRHRLRLVCAARALELLSSAECEKEEDLGSLMELLE